MLVKAAKQKKEITNNRAPICLAVDSLEILQTWRMCHNIFNALKKDFHPRIIYQVKIPFKHKGGIK